MAVLPPDPVFSLRCPEMGAVNSICFHESERLLAGTLKGKVFLWDLQVRNKQYQQQQKLFEEEKINNAKNLLNCRQIARHFISRWAVIQ